MRHRDLRVLGREFEPPRARGLEQMQVQRATRVVRPQLVGLEAMEARPIAGPEQVQDAGREAAVALESRGQRGRRDALGTPPRLAIPAALGMRGERQRACQIGGVHRRTGNGQTTGTAASAAVGLRQMRRTVVLVLILGEVVVLVILVVVLVLVRVLVVGVLIVVIGEGVRVPREQRHLGVVLVLLLLDELAVVVVLVRVLVRIVVILVRELGLDVVAEHRPEIAWCVAEPALPAPTTRCVAALRAVPRESACLRRPLWLLRAPAVTARLETDFIAPVPIGTQLHINAQITGQAGRKVYSAAVGRIGSPEGPIAVTASALFIIVPMSHFLENAPKEYLEHIKKNPEILSYLDPEFEINP